MPSLPYKVFPQAKYRLSFRTSGFDLPSIHISFSHNVCLFVLRKSSILITTSYCYHHAWVLAAFYVYFQFLLQLSKISSILILQTSKLRHIKIYGTFRVREAICFKTGLWTQAIQFQCLVLLTLPWFPSGHMLSDLPQMSLSFQGIFDLSTNVPPLALLPSTGINRSLVQEEWLLLHFYSRPFQAHSIFAWKKLKLNISGIFLLQASEPNI